MRIKAVKGRGTGIEELQLVLGKEPGEKVEFVRAYGANP